jgi:hypothetical protein
MLRELRSACGMDGEHMKRTTVKHGILLDRIVVGSRPKIGGRP